MKNLKKIVSIVLITVLLLCIFSVEVRAETDSIESIDIEVYINEDGVASITEVWVCSIYSGTELYKPYYDLYTSEISDLSVTDETGTVYTYLTDWDINASQSDKAGKCGIYISGDETDICWGIGEYGEHTYTITYTISNFVQQYDDYQNVYFTLLQDGMDPVPESATITISASFDFDESSVSVSGYGYSGTAEIEDGKAVFATNGSLGSTGYMNVYLEFSNNPFDAEDMTLETTDEYYYDDYYQYGGYGEYGAMSIDEEEENTSSKLWTTYVPLGIIIVIIVLVIIFIIYKRRDNNNDNQNYPDYQNYNQ